MTPGQYTLPLEQYLELPAVSAGLLHTITTECPQAAWFESWLNPNRERRPTKASDAGSVAHEILLEGSEHCVEIFNPAEFPNATGPGVAHGWSNQAIQTAKADCIARGKIPMLADDMTTIRNMVASARRFIDSLKSTEPAIWTAFQEGCGESEQSVIWDEDGTLCRMRPDRMAIDRKLIVDAKFTDTNVEPNDWARRQMGPLGYWTRAAWYRRGFRHAYGTDPSYFFLVVGQKAPHLCSLVGVDPAGFEHGAMKVERGLRTWQECVDRGWWPGYPARVCYPELKPWELAEELERSGLDRDGIPYDPAELYGTATA